MVADNMMRQMESDPNFEAKFNLLEKQDLSVGLSDDPRTSTKNMQFWRVEFDEKQFGQEGFSVLDQSLGYMAERHQSTANSLKNSLENPRHGRPPEMHQDAQFLRSASFLQQAQEAGLDASISIPKVSGDYLFRHKIENGEIVEMGVDELLDIDATGGQHPSVEAFSESEPISQKQLLDRQGPGLSM